MLMGTQEIGSAKCITGNPAKSAWVGGGFCVITFRFACDHPSPTVRPSTRTRRYWTSGNCVLVAAQIPLITTNECTMFPVEEKLSGPPYTALVKQSSTSP